MLDELLKLALAQLQLDEAAVDEWRTETGTMTGNEDVGLTRQRQLKNLLMSSTPIDQQIDSFEQTYWKLEADSAALIKDAAVKLLALARQRAKVDALKEHRLRQREAPAEVNAEGLHRNYVQHCITLRALGAGPHHMQQLKLGEEAIFADLARWKAEDPRCENPDNPWIDILSIYDHRTMEKVERGKKAGSRSQPGAPPADRPEVWGTKYWRFRTSQYPPSWGRQPETQHRPSTMYSELPPALAEQYKKEEVLTSNVMPSPAQDPAPTPPPQEQLLSQVAVVPDEAAEPGPGTQTITATSIGPISKTDSSPEASLQYVQAARDLSKRKFRTYGQK